MDTRQNTRSTPDWATIGVVLFPLWIILAVVADATLSGGLAQ